MWQTERLQRAGEGLRLGHFRPEGRRQAGGHLGVAGYGPRHLSLDPGPGARIRHQRADQRMVELVAATHRTVGAEQGPARQRQIADHVQHFVANELVGKTRTLGVEDPVVAYDQRVLERGAERIARVPQRRHVAHEAEGAGARDVATERFRLHVDRQCLTPDQRVLELDLRLDAEAARVGPYLSERVSPYHSHGLEDPDVAPGLIKRLKTDRVDCRDKWGRAAVHDRRFGTIDFNDGVVDAEARERGQYVLGGGYQRPGGVAQHGGEFGGGDRAHVGGDLTILPAVDMGADKAQAGVGVGRMQRQRDR